MSSIKKAILNWLWKMGYSVGKSIANFGHGIFHDGAIKGMIKTLEDSSTMTASGIIDNMMGRLDIAHFTDLIDSETYTLDTMADAEFHETFVQMFADEDDHKVTGVGSESWEAAEQAYLDAGWTVEYFYLSTNPGQGLSTDADGNVGIDSAVAGVTIHALTTADLNAGNPYNYARLSKNGMTDTWLNTQGIIMYVV